MNFLKKNPSLKEQKAELTRYGMQNPKLLPELISPFSEVTQKIYLRLSNMPQKDFTDAFKSKLREIMSIIRDSYSEPTLNSIVKKMGFIFVFLNFGCSDKRIDENLSAYFTQEVQNLLIEIEQLENPQLKRQRSSSLKKMQLYLREKSLMGKKDESKLKIEQNDDKTVIKRILNKIIEPFCMYLLKILQDHHIYATFIRSQIESIDGSNTWKMFNWINIMGSIVMEMNRLARYFKDDLVGMWVFISYLISKDASAYYSNIVIKMNQSTEKWMDMIHRIQQIKKINRQKAKVESKEVLKDPEFIELKNEIQQIQKIRECMKYLYNNARLKQWKGYFVIPKFPIAEKVAQNKVAEDEIKYFIQEFDNCEKKSNSNSKSSVRSLREHALHNHKGKKTQENPSVTSQKSVMDKTIEIDKTIGQNLAVTTVGDDQAVLKANPFQSKKAGFFAQKRSTIMGRN